VRRRTGIQFLRIGGLNKPTLLSGPPAGC
jgi:hypothetical protein